MNNYDNSLEEYLTVKDTIIDHMESQDPLDLYDYLFDCDKSKQIITTIMSYINRYECNDKSKLAVEAMDLIEKSMIEYGRKCLEESETICYEDDTSFVMVRGEYHVAT